MNKEVEVFNSMPVDWKEIKGATTAPNGYIWISNNKSRFGGERKNGLLKLPTN